MNFGDVVGGFRIESLVGRGGTASVYRACRPGEEPVALKIVSASHASEITVARMSREARLLSTFTHPRLPRTLARGYDQPARAWYVATTLVPGESLLARIERHGSLDWMEVQRIVDDVAGALAVLHENGVMHRDVSPSNIVVVTDERDQMIEAHLVDLGLGMGEGDEQLTTTGRVYGTLPYVAPERLRDGRSPATALADQYALATVVHDALAGMPAWDEVGAARVLADCLTASGRRELPPTVPRGARQALVRARLAASEARYVSVNAFADAFAMRTAPGWARPTIIHALGAVVACVAFFASMGAVVAVAVGLTALLS